MIIKEKGVLENSQAYFHTPSNIAKSLFFYLTCVGHFYCGQGYCVERQQHDSFLLMYVKDGNGLLKYDDKSIHLKSGDMVLLNCHRYHLYQSDNWETQWLHFSGNITDAYFQIIHDKLGCVIPIKEQNVIIDLLYEIIDSFANNTPISEPLVSCHIQRILAELMQLPATEVVKSKTSSSVILSSINFIRENYHKKLALDDLATNVNISPYHFSRLFKKETGYSPYEYITITRLNQAKTLLKTTDLTIKEIAFSVGFNSESNFVTCFKKHGDVTPSKFRTTSV